jgi:hypothetical protein
MEASLLFDVLRELSIKQRVNGWRSKIAAIAAPPIAIRREARDAVRSRFTRVASFRLGALEHYMKCLARTRQQLMGLSIAAPQLEFQIPFPSSSLDAIATASVWKLDRIRTRRGPSAFPKTVLLVPHQRR